MKKGESPVFSPRGVKTCVWNASDQFPPWPKVHRLPSKVERIGLPVDLYVAWLG